MRWYSQPRALPFKLYTASCNLCINISDGHARDKGDIETGIRLDKETSE